MLMGPRAVRAHERGARALPALVHIPTGPEFGSLNLAMAVQVLCYELRMAAPIARRPRRLRAKRRLATAAELEGLHEHLERLLTEAEFLHPAHQRQVMPDARIFHNATLE